MKSPKTDAEPGGDQAIKEQLLVTMEEIGSNRITTGAIRSRLARLEAELNRMQRLVELKTPDRGPAIGGRDARDTATGGAGRRANNACHRYRRNCPGARNDWKTPAGSHRRRRRS